MRFWKKPFFAQGVAETTKAARKDLQRAAVGSEREGWIHRRGAQPPKEQREAMLYRALRHRAGGLFAKRPGEKPAKAARRGGSASGRQPVRPASGAPPVPAPGAGKCRRALQWSAAHQERARKMPTPGKDNRNLAFAKRRKRHREINTACFYRCGKAE